MKITFSKWVRPLCVYIFILYGLKVLRATRIENSTNEILFKPIGKLIPELSWNTVKTKINTTDMFKETNKLCKAVHLIKKRI